MVATLVQQEQRFLLCYPKLSSLPPGSRTPNAATSKDLPRTRDSGAWSNQTQTMAQSLLQPYISDSMFSEDGD